MKHSLRSAARFAAGCGILAALVCPATSQNTVVIPNGLANTEGNTSNLFPWGRGNNFIHIEFLYSNSHFLNAGVNTPIAITRLRWRADGGPNSWTGGTYANVRVDLSTAAVAHNSPSTNFAANHGPNVTMVHNGPVTMSPGTTTGIGTGPYFVDLPLTTPFVYDPNAGRPLCVEVQFDSTQWGGGSFAFLDVQSTGSLATRIFNSTVWPSTTGTIGQNHGAVMEVSYAPATGLSAGFTAQATSGAAPLTVQFTDCSYSSAPGGIVAWLWDLDGDGLPDSTQRNPTFTYTGCGSYNVSLQVFDSQHAPSTFTRANFVTTDEVKPAFTWARTGPNTIQFTDTSSPPASAWAWDLDGDGNTDSTLQNPTFTYPRGCTVVPNVRLQVTRACQGPFTTTRSVYVGESLDTTYAGGSDTITTWGNLFDLQVLQPQGISVCALSTIANGSLGTPFTIDVYVTPNTYVGNITTPTAWRLVGTASGTVAGINVPSMARFPSSVYLPPGNYGVALYSFGTGCKNSNGTQTFANADLSMTLGVQRTDLFGSLGQFGFTNANRIWNGTFHYTTEASSGEAGYGFLGAGCAGSLGVPRNTVVSPPRLGQSMASNYTNLAQDVVFALVGFSRTMSGVGALPFDLTAVGAPGCWARVSPDAVLVLVGNAGVVNFAMAIPNSAAYLGAQLFTQGLSLDTVNALGAVASDANGAILGL
ncbi:MAG: PKD domain-containing protein [Planctomycetes bacterium]|nr:PKD domain-containing protein [Planctomycetota bacterium]